MPGVTSGIYKILRSLASAALVLGVALLYRYAITAVNNTTIALTLLLTILGIAAVWGLGEAILASILAVLAFNFFFLPPVSGFTIQDPQNWVAFAAFLVTAFAASQLSVRAKRRAAEAVDRRLEVEKLYSLGQAMLLIGELRTAPGEMVRGFMRIYDVPAVAFYGAADGALFRSGPKTLVVTDQQLKDAAAFDAPAINHESQIALVPLRLGGQSIGSLALIGGTLSLGALNAVAYLIAIGLERVRALEETSRIEAARQSEMLKSALLDALAHELKTPLTSIKGAVTHLISRAGDAEEKELLTLANEETDRLISLISEIIEMARIEAGKLEIHRRPHQIGDIIDAAMKELHEPLKRRPIERQIDSSIPPVEIDADMVLHVVKQLLDNAVKYSPSGSPIQILAREQEGKVIVSVSDKGKGIDRQEQASIFDKFFRGRQSRYEVAGTGLGLSIARGIVEANGGEIWVTSEPGHGSTFSFSLPRFHGGRNR